MARKAAAGKGKKGKKAQSTDKNFVDHFAALEISPEASTLDVERAFRRLTLLHGPGEANEPEAVAAHEKVCYSNRLLGRLCPPSLNRGTR